MAALAANSCIERTNPFDPINSGDARILTIRDQLRPGLEARAAGEDAYRSKLAAFDSAFRSDSISNAGIIVANEGRKSRNATLASGNAAVVADNATAAPDDLRLQQPYLTVLPLQPYGSGELDGSQRDLRAQTANLALFMSQANAANSPATIFPTAFSDSILAPFVRDSAAFAALRLRIDSGNRMVEGYNAEVQKYNLLQADANRHVDNYNDSIIYRKAVGNHPVYVRADSLLSGVKAAQAGDTLYIGQGAYSVDLRFNHSGTTQAPIVITGYPGGKTILQASEGASRVMVLSGNAHIRFQDIVFKGGVKLDNSSHDAVFRRCVFTGSAEAGLDVTDSRVQLSDCRITENAAGARFSFSGDTDQVRMVNVLIARNSDDGLYLNNPSGELRNCTISDNGGDGIELIIQRNAFAIYNSIISGNRQLGLFRQMRKEWPQQPTVEYCDLWGNQQGDWSLEGLETNAIKDMQSLDFSLEPVFVDPAALDYGLKPASTLYEWESQTPPLKVGYRP